MSGYVCNLCDDPGHPVVQLHTNLTNGQTAAVCLDCMPVALVGALAAELGIDAQRLYDNIRRFAEREAKSAAKAEAEATETVVPSPAAQDARDEWIADQGGEDAIKHRMTDPLLALQESETGE